MTIVSRRNVAARPKKTWKQMESIKIFVFTYIIFCIFRFYCLERLICRVEGAAEQPDRVINWARHLICSHCQDLATSSLFHILLEDNHRKFTNAWRNSALSRIIIFAKFDRASSRFCQTCPRVQCNVYNLQNVAPQVAEFWCLHPVKQGLWAVIEIIQSR